MSKFKDLAIVFEGLVDPCHPSRVVGVSHIRPCSCPGTLLALGASRRSTFVYITVSSGRLCMNSRWWGYGREPTLRRRDPQVMITAMLSIVRGDLLVDSGSLATMENRSRIV
jgi:hypothetical protein